MDAEQIRPVADGLFEADKERPYLIGARRKADGRIVFPAPAGAESALYERVRLADQGALWSFTVQRFQPKPPYAGKVGPEGFRPYAVGYIELPGQVIVESRLDIADFAQLRIGMPMRLCLQRFERAGGPVLTYCFRAAALAGPGA